MLVTIFLQSQMLPCKNFVKSFFLVVGMLFFSEVRALDKNEFYLIADGGYRLSTINSFEFAGSVGWGLADFWGLGIFSDVIVGEISNGRRSGIEAKFCVEPFEALTRIGLYHDHLNAPMVVLGANYLKGFAPSLAFLSGIRFEPVFWGRASSLTLGFGFRLLL